MFAVGHLAWSYLLGRGLARPLNVKVSTPLLIVISLIPDADLVLGLTHRGPSHSLILYVLLFTPLLIAYRRRAVPYFAALALHVVFCDYTTGYVMMLWPVTSSWYGMNLSEYGALNMMLEWAGFTAAMMLLWRTGDLRRMLTPHASNLLLVVPIVEVGLQVYPIFSYSIPAALIIPHAICTCIFLASVVRYLGRLIAGS